MQCFRPFHTAERTIEGVEALHMMRKGQVKSIDGRDALGQAKFVASLSGIATQPKSYEALVCLKAIFATQQAEACKAMPEFSC